MTGNDVIAMRYRKGKDYFEDCKCFPERAGGTAAAFSVLWGGWACANGLWDSVVSSFKASSIKKEAKQEPGP